MNLGRRELRVRYSQAILGFAWALLTPLALMVAFSFIGSKFNIETNGIARPVFSYTGLLAWTFFAGAVSSAGGILIANPLLNKVYAPREVFPLATIGTSAVDAFAASIALAVLFVVYGEYPQATSVWAPLYLLVLLAFTVGLGLILSALTVYARDIRHALPLMLQVGLFITPVVYGLEYIDEKYRAIYVFLNPVAMVIDGLRETVLYGNSPNFAYLGLGTLSSLATLVFGYMLFKKLETGFADVS